MTDKGYYAENMDGERIWYASPDRERCGGHGYMRCLCGGDQCYCGNQGEIECFGCVDCDRADDEYYDRDEESYPEDLDEIPEPTSSKSVGPPGDTNG